MTNARNDGILDGGSVAVGLTFGAILSAVIVLCVGIVARITEPTRDATWTVTDSHGNVYENLEMTSDGSGTHLHDANGRRYVFKGTHSYVEERVEK